jgi:hypothetical protein
MPVVSKRAGGRRTANFSPCSIGTDKEAVIGVAILDL